MPMKLKAKWVKTCKLPYLSYPYHINWLPSKPMLIYKPHYPMVYTISIATLPIGRNWRLSLNASTSAHGSKKPNNNCKHNRAIYLPNLLPMHQKQAPPPPNLPPLPMRSITKPLPPKHNLPHCSNNSPKLIP